MSLISIYQVFTRLATNRVNSPIYNGTIEQNGVGKLNDFTPEVLKAIKELGVTHVWYTGIIEHARCTANAECGIEGGNPRVIKGLAGSPYAITDYYDIDPDLAVSVPNRMQEFARLVKHTHDAGLKVIIDFVPNHVSRLYKSDVFPERDFGKNDNPAWAFSIKNDFYYIVNQDLVLPENSGAEVEGKDQLAYFESPAKVTGNNQFSAWPTIDDWYETVKLNYGVDYQNGGQGYFDPQPSVWGKMVDILLYWASKGVDAFRCDMVEMTPVEFWEFAIAEVNKQYPNVKFIAEVYNPSMYADYVKRGGFHYLYDKVGLYDTLRAIVSSDAPAYNLSGCWQRLGGLDANMVRFLENHDEQRVASRFFSPDPQKAIPAMLASATMNQGAVMTYFGQEVGEPALGKTGYSGDDGRTTIFDYYNVPSFQRWYNNGKPSYVNLTIDQQMLRDQYAEILNLAISEPCFTDGAFYDIMWVNNPECGVDNTRIFAYLRYTATDAMLVVLAFNGDKQLNFNLRIPEHAWNAMGVNLASAVKLKPVLGVANPFDASVGQLIYNGLPMQMQPSSGVVFRIEW